MVCGFVNDTGTTEIYTEGVVGSVRWVSETGSTVSGTSGQGGVGVALSIRGNGSIYYGGGGGGGVYNRRPYGLMSGSTGAGDVGGGGTATPTAASEGLGGLGGG